MFTGIIETIGKVVEVENHGDDWRLSISADNLNVDNTVVGDSIAVNGVCLSVIEISDSKFTVDVSDETLSCTTLSNIQTGGPVNLERALQLSDRLHGHIVTGHVDGIGCIIERKQMPHSEQFIIESPERLMRFICSKGSICVDGVSLTVNDVDKNRFSVNIIPHTLKETLFNIYQAGSKVNLEIDVIARYIDSLRQSPE